MSETIEQIDAYGLYNVACTALASAYDDALISGERAEWVVNALYDVADEAMRDVYESTLNDMHDATEALQQYGTAIRAFELLAGVSDWVPA